MMQSSNAKEKTVTLSDIYRPIEKELVEVSREFEKELKGYDGFSSIVLEFLLGDRGKMLRPALVLFSAQIGGQFSHCIVKLATSIELLHTATLIHDDVLDEAMLRRRKETLNFRWGNEISVVLGDYVYAKSFIILSELREMKVLQDLIETAKVICMGELGQLVARYDFSLSEEKYVTMIERKTASLISRACELGAYLGGASKEEVERLSQYGLYFGIGFQIVDDCLDLVGDEEKMGKSLGTDIQKGKPTLPLIYLLQKISDAEKKKIKEIIQESQNGEAADEIRRLVARHGTVERSMERARAYMQMAKREVADLKVRQTQESLAHLAEYTLTRSH
ncbi:MAG: polyprenyl synthetase family protein [Candidatus Omnitrophica bacterium]|nr:polyprenyl synthetase family protein [Candidatus Omnitrophota bacterium]